MGEFKDFMGEVKDFMGEVKETMEEKMNQIAKEKNVSQALQEKNLDSIFKVCKNDNWELMYEGTLTFSDRSECYTSLHIHSTWVTIIFGIKQLDDNYNEGKILSLLNQFNEESPFTKFFITDPDIYDEVSICAMISYPIRDSFDAEIYIDTLTEAFESIHNKYQPKIRKLLRNNINNTL